MAKLRKFVTQTDWLWYEVELTPEQLVEYQKHGDEWEELYDLDWDLVRDKPASDEIEYTLIPDEHDVHLRTNGSGGVL